MLAPMSVFEHRPALRWLVPLLAAVLLGAGTSTVGIVTAAARGGLPHRSAAQLLVDVQKARLDGLSGTVVQNAALGLPSVPGAEGSGSSNMSSLVSGSHTLRLWYADPDHVRIALQGTLGESDLVRNGRDLWSWSSSDKSATHRVVPLSSNGTGHSLASASPVTPQQAADEALKAITPSTEVRTSGTATVAGRSAYELVLRPRERGSLVDSVRIAIDGKTRVPTRVQVFAKHVAKPALEVGFTSFDPSRPPRSMFRFNPPPHTKVTDSGSAAPSKAHADQGRSAKQKDDAGSPPRVVGKGWTSVVVAHVPSGALTGSPTTARMLAALPPVSGSWGSGRLLRGTLFSAVLTNDGRVAVGAVAPDALYTALAPS